MFLEIRELSVLYQQAKAITSVSLKVNEGEIVAVVGANGAGKTTLLRAISGLKKSVSGEIWFKSERIDRKPANEITKMGII